MLNDVYKTIAYPSEGIYKDKGSKFLAYAYPVSNEEQIKTLLFDLKKKYYDARHHCYAYRLGPSGEQWRAVDDGEPSSSAGKPILGQLLSGELTDIVVFVVRYFGGIKLGVPGLIHAYRAATTDALANAEIIEKEYCEVFDVQFDYLMMNDIMKIIKDEQPDVLEQVFEMRCTLKVSIRKGRADLLKGKLLKVSSASIEEVND